MRITKGTQLRSINVLYFAASQSPWGSVLRFDVTANLCLKRLRDPARDYCSLVDVALY